MRRPSSWWGRAPTDPAPVDWATMRSVYDARLKDLELLTIIGQGLVAAVTLPAALGGPLLVLGTERTWPYLGLGVGLLLYVVVLGVALRYALRVLFGRVGPRTRRPREGVMSWEHVSGLTPEAYRRLVLGADREQLLTSLIEQDRICASLVAAKASHVPRAIRWASVSFAMLALLILARFVIIYSSA